MPLAGCENGIDTTYGRRSGSVGGDSVNGTAVLAGMFERAGHSVSKSSRLSPRVREKADAIVWAPDDFSHPTKEVCDWFDEWWRDKPGRVMIYIGRDFDAAPGYWRAVQSGAPQGQLREIKRRLAESQNAFRQRRAGLPEKEEGSWCTVEGRRRRRDVRTLDGEWAAGVAPERTEIELNGRLVPSGGPSVPPPENDVLVHPMEPVHRAAGDAKTLLSSNGDVLVSRRAVEEGSLVLIVNGSFLLNEPLVNVEHRKLAAKLIAEVAPRQRVVFLESGPGGPPLLDKEPDEAIRSGLEIFGVYPFNWIFLHLAVLGLIFCVARFPIFGTPRSLDPVPLSDFGRHVWALGKLLERTGDRVYALSRLQHYQQNVRREPGRYRRGTSAGSAVASPFAAPPQPPHGDAPVSGAPPSSTKSIAPSSLHPQETLNP
ncbi:MAG TPA: hypothetical protein VND64_06325 [Pirellulales bacterium]|nr:hypothetical protein [Pirellulales bacterium]